MDVSKLLSPRYIILSLAIVFSASCGAAVDAGSEEVLEHLSRKILKATASYGERIEYCDKIVASSDVPKFDKEQLTKLKASREDVVAAVAYLTFNNYFLCERNERLGLAFYLGAMESLKSTLNVDSSSVSELQSAVSYPSIRELNLELDYLKLPQSQRDYYESIVGDAPFDLMRTLKKNSLIRE